LNAQVRPYQPGDAGRLLALQAAYYAGEWGFNGRFFEALVARDMGDLLSRLDDPRNGLWRAEVDGNFVGGIAIDGSSAAPNGVLRWFMLDESSRGQGLGKRLLATAIEHCRDKGFDAIHLHTFAGLDAARALYEDAGFSLTEELDNDTWGSLLREQRFTLPLKP